MASLPVRGGGRKERERRRRRRGERGERETGKEGRKKWLGFYRERVDERRVSIVVFIWHIGSVYSLGMVSGFINGNAIQDIGSI